MPRNQSTSSPGDDWKYANETSQRHRSKVVLMIMNLVMTRDEDNDDDAKDYNDDDDNAR